MKRLAILWTAGALLSGCISAPAPNPWDTVDVAPTATTRPLPLGKFPQPASFDDNTITYDASGVGELDAYRDRAEANTIVADSHADQVIELKAATRALVEAGKAQRRVADLNKEILADERRHWFWERLSYWAGLILIGASTL